MSKLSNREIANTFATIGDMLEIKGESIHRILAYRRGAETISNLDGLKEAAEGGKLRDMSGMGAKSEAVILEGIASLARRTDRISIGDAYPIAMRMLERLLQIDGAQRGDVAGSLRR